MSILFLIEFLHFLAGTYGFFFDPQYVINSYTLHPEITSNVQTFEMMRVSAVFYLSFVLVCLINIIDVYLNLYTSIMFTVFYFAFILYDVNDIVKYGYSTNKSRYMDTAVHVIMGFVHLYMVVKFFY